MAELKGWADVSDTKITFIDNGPCKVEGGVSLRDTDGELIEHVRASRSSCVAVVDLPTSRSVTEPTTTTGSTGGWRGGIERRDLLVAGVR